MTAKGFIQGQVEAIVGSMVALHVKVNSSDLSLFKVWRASAAADE